MYSCHIESSSVLAQLVTTNRSVNSFPGQVQYFFEHSVNLLNGLVEHKLAYIQWYKPVNSRYYVSSTDDDGTCNVELWNPEFCPAKRECIILIHNIFGRFIPFRYKISNRKNSKEYL